MEYTSLQKEELLAYAKINYPPGTIFKGCTGRHLEVSGTVFMILKGGQISVETTTNNSTSTFNGKGAAIYLVDKKWMKIIHKPILILNYEIY